MRAIPVLIISVVTGFFLATAAEASTSMDRLSRSALIIGVGQYASAEIPPLPGVALDMDSATRIAREMGIPVRNITMLRDAQATKARIVAELEALAARVGEGGRVFLYFSGHGTRWWDPAISGCKEGLLSYDRETLTNDEIAVHSRRMSERADKVIVMFDACHSEGVNSPRPSTRSLAARGGLTPKFFLKGGQNAEACSRPSNLKTRSLLAEATRLGALSENFVHISSSRADEVSFDEPGQGGIATQAVRDCLLGRARDVDGSGAVSMSEIEQCAQSIVNAKLQPFPDHKPHHVTVRGNRNIVPVAVLKPPAATPPATNSPISQPPAFPAPPTANPNPPAPQVIAAITEPKPPAVTPNVGPVPSLPTVAPDPAPVPVPSPSIQVSQPTRPVPSPVSAPLPVLVTVPAPPSPEPASVPQGQNSALTVPGMAAASLATLREIEQQRDPRRRLEVVLARQQVRIGKDPLELTITSSHAGYVYLVLLGSDRKSFYVLFPNGLDDDNRIQPKRPLVLPRPDWRLIARGPEGENQLLVMVTATPRDLRTLSVEAPTAAAPFTYSLNDLQGRGALLDFLIGRGVTGASETFGAQLLSVREVK